jgi:hypothetical protein
MNTATVTTVVVPFGRFKGKALKEINTPYLFWLYSRDNLYSPFRECVEEEFLHRCREAPLPATDAAPPERTLELIEIGFKFLARISRSDLQEAIAARAWLIRCVAELQGEMDVE